MGDSAKWITPFLKQCFVTAGVVFNLAGVGAVLGYTSSLLPQLRQPDSYIDIDDSSGSWIAAIVGLAIFPSNLIVPVLMGKLGRRTTNIISIVPNVIGWIVIATAESVTSIIIARFMQGLSLGMTMTFGPALIGEYTSPKYRGSFLSTISLSITLGIVLVHFIGLFLLWHTIALFFASTSVITLALVIFSPESPSWLIDQGRYEDGKRTFRWLRGSDEEDELKKMIAADIVMKESKASNGSKLISMNLSNSLSYFNRLVKKPEFYKPIVIGIHLNGLIYWGGTLIFTSYPVDLIHHALGSKANVSTVIIIIGVLRLVSNIITLYVIKKIKRKTMLLTTGVVLISILLVIAAYVFARNNDILPYDSPLIGYILLAINIFALVPSTLTLPYIIAGEIFPLEYRSLASAISSLPATPNFIIVLKSIPFLLKTIGLHGTYLLYAGIVGYCLIVSCIMLPETKDRTLLDIENEFRGKKLEEELNSVELLEKG